jgi:hypothetical protein
MSIDIFEALLTKMEDRIQKQTISWRRPGKTSGSNNKVSEI